MTFGQHIKNHRKASGLKQKAAAKQIGCSPTFLSLLEQDKTAMPAEAKIQKMAEVYGADFDELMMLAGRIPKRMQERITSRPALYWHIKHLLDVPDQQVEQLSRQVRDGEW